MNKLKTARLIPFAIFTILGLLALQIPINNLAGSGARFTLFDVLAPTAGAFLGSVFGIVSVFLMGAFNLLITGTIDRGSLIRLFPVLFAVLFFARAKDKSSKWLLIIPALSILSWNLNPVGRSVWYYSMFWTIPFWVYPVVGRSLVARSLASTFVAHSAGGAIWIWAFALPASVWKGLIPVVAIERSIMALGIAASYILINNLVPIASKKFRVIRSVKTDKAYLLNR